MRQVMIRYTVKPEAVEENTALVEAVYEELQSRRPSTLRYRTFLLDDGVTFVHMAEDEATEEGGTLAGLPAFRRFREGIRERCAVAPVSTTLTTIGRYQPAD
jgi:hypothetical protein